MNIEKVQEIRKEKRKEEFMQLLRTATAVQATAQVSKLLNRKRAKSYKILQALGTLEEKSWAALAVGLNWMLAACQKTVD